LFRFSLELLLSGGCHTQERRSKSKMFVYPGLDCLRCGARVDNTLHSCWTCPASEPARTIGRQALDLTDWTPAPCEVMSGVILQDPEALDCFNNQVLKCVPEFPSKNDLTFNELYRNTHVLQDDGLSFTLVGTDGSCIYPTFPLLARAGAGIYWGSGHPLNAGVAVPGGPQTAQHAELYGLYGAMQLAFDNTAVVTDSAFVADTFKQLLCAEGRLPDGYLKWAHADLWARVANLVVVLPYKFRVYWSPGHKRAEAVIAGVVNAFSRC